MWKGWTIGDPCEEDKINMIKVENKLENFLLPQIPTSQPLILCFVLLDPVSFLVFNNSLLKCKYLLGVVKSYQLIVDCCRSIGSCFIGVRMAESWGATVDKQIQEEETVFTESSFFFFLALTYILSRMNSAHHYP